MRLLNVTKNKMLTIQYFDISLHRKTIKISKVGTRAEHQPLRFLYHQIVSIYNISNRQKVHSINKASDGTQS